MRAVDRSFGLAAFALGSLALIQLGCGSLASQHRDEAPEVLRQYAMELRRLNTSQFVHVPPEVAWNTVVGRLQGKIPIQVSDFESRVIQTHWHYAPPRQAEGTAVQERQRFKVELLGEDTGSYRTNVTAVAERRSRTTCTETSEWTPVAMDTTRLQNNLDADLRALGRVPFEQLPFPGTPSEILPILSDLIIRRWGLAPMPDGLKFPIVSSWREREFPREQWKIEVRSSVQVNAVPLDDSHVKLVADAEVQHRGVNADGSTPWVEANPIAVREDFYAHVVERLRPGNLTRKGGEVITVADPEPPEFPLPRPPDPLMGTYALSIVGVVAPRKQANGLDWDPGAITQAVLSNVKRIAKVAALIPEPNIQAAARLADQIPHEFCDAAARLVGQYTAPDIQVILAVPGVGVVGTPVVENSYMASWGGTLDFVANGNVEIGFDIWDIDPIGADDHIGRGSFSLGELANACRPVCKGDHRGGMICLALRRVR